MRNPCKSDPSHFLRFPEFFVEFAFESFIWFIQLVHCIHPTLWLQPLDRWPHPRNRVFLAFHTFIRVLSTFSWPSSSSCNNSFYDLFRVTQLPNVFAHHSLSFISCKCDLFLTDLEYSYLVCSLAVMFPLLFP